MSDVVVLVPVLSRPHRAAPFVESLHETAPGAAILFLCSPSDAAEIASCERTGASVAVVAWEPGPGDYARKINAGVRLTTEPWVLQAADDIRFHPGWLDAAMDVADRTGVDVVGTNDLCNPRVMRGAHATHSLVRRDYIEDPGATDRPGELLHEGYLHNFVDDELVQIARVRRRWAFAAKSHVEHLHHLCGKSDDDDTYRRGVAGFDRDRALFRKRMNGMKQRMRRGG